MVGLCLLMSIKVFVRPMELRTTGWFSTSSGAWTTSFNNTGQIIMDVIFQYIDPNYNIPPYYESITFNKKEYGIISSIEPLFIYEE